MAEATGELYDRKRSRTVRRGTDGKGACYSHLASGLPYHVAEVDYGETVIVESESPAMKEPPDGWRMWG